VATTTAAITPKAWRDFCLTTSFLARSRGTDSPIARTIYLFFRIGRILRVRCRSRWLLAGAGLVYALVCAHPGAGLVGTSPAFGKDGGSSGGSGGGGGSGSGGGGSSSGGGGSSGGSGGGSGSSGDGGSGGSGGGSGSGGGGSSGGGSGGSGPSGGGPGSSGSGSSGSGGGDNSGPDGASEANGGGSPGSGSLSHVYQRSGGLELLYSDGFREEISHGILELTDPAGRTVIKRVATPADYVRFRKRR
jgi:hypothetical protein